MGIDPAKALTSANSLASRLRKPDPTPVGSFFISTAAELLGSKESTLSSFFLEDAQGNAGKVTATVALQKLRQFVQLVQENRDLNDAEKKQLEALIAQLPQMTILLEAMEILFPSSGAASGESNPAKVTDFLIKFLSIFDGDEDKKEIAQILISQIFKFEKPDGTALIINLDSLDTLAAQLTDAKITIAPALNEGLLATRDFFQTIKETLEDIQTDITPGNPINPLKLLNDPNIRKAIAHLKAALATPEEQADAGALVIEVQGTKENFQLGNGFNLDPLLIPEVVALFSAEGKPKILAKDDTIGRVLATRLGLDSDHALTEILGAVLFEGSEADENGNLKESRPIIDVNEIKKGLNQLIDLILLDLMTLYCATSNSQEKEKLLTQMKAVMEFRKIPEWIKNENTTDVERILNFITDNLLKRDDSVLKLCAPALGNLKNYAAAEILLVLIKYLQGSADDQHKGRLLEIRTELVATLKTTRKNANGQRDALAQIAPTNKDAPLLLSGTLADGVAKAHGSGHGSSTYYTNLNFLGKEFTWNQATWNSIQREFNPEGKKALLPLIRELAPGLIDANGNFDPLKIPKDPKFGFDLLRAYALARVEVDGKTLEDQTAFHVAFTKFFNLFVLGKSESLETPPTSDTDWGKAYVLWTTLSDPTETIPDLNPSDLIATLAKAKILAQHDNEKPLNEELGKSIDRLVADVGTDKVSKTNYLLLTALLAQARSKFDKITLDGGGGKGAERTDDLSLDAPVARILDDLRQNAKLSKFHLAHIIESLGTLETQAREKGETVSADRYAQKAQTILERVLAVLPDREKDSTKPTADQIFKLRADFSAAKEAVAKIDADTTKTETEKKSARLKEIDDQSVILPTALDSAPDAPETTLTLLRDALIGDEDKGLDDRIKTLREEEAARKEKEGKGGKAKPGDTAPPSTGGDYGSGGAPKGGAYGSGGIQGSVRSTGFFNGPVEDISVSSTEELPNKMTTVGETAISGLFRSPKGFMGSAGETIFHIDDQKQGFVVTPNKKDQSTDGKEESPKVPTITNFSVQAVTFKDDGTTDKNGEAIEFPAGEAWGIQFDDRTVLTYIPHQGNLEGYFQFTAPSEAGVRADVKRDKVTTFGALKRFSGRSFEDDFIHEKPELYYQYDRKNNLVVKGLKGTFRTPGVFPEVDHLSQAGEFQAALNDLKSLKVNFSTDGTKLHDALNASQREREKFFATLQRIQAIPTLAQPNFEFSPYTRAQYDQAVQDLSKAQDLAENWSSYTDNQRIPILDRLTLARQIFDSLFRKELEKQLAKALDQDIDIDAIIQQFKSGKSIEVLLLMVLTFMLKANNKIQGRISKTLLATGEILGSMSPSEYNRRPGKMEELRGNQQAAMTHSQAMMGERNQWNEQISSMLKSFWDTNQSIARKLA